MRWGTKRVPVLRDGQIARVERTIAAVAKAAADLNALVLPITEAIKSTREPPIHREGWPLHFRASEGSPAASARFVSQRQTEPSVIGAPTGKLPPGELAVLKAAAARDEGAGRNELSVLTGYKRSSRDAYVARLRTKGYVQEGTDRRIIATEDGVRVLGDDHEPLPSGDALRSWWLADGRLPPGEHAVLEILIAEYPKAVGRERISEGTEYRRSSRDAYVARLKARRLVEVAGGGVRASATLFDQ